MTARGFVLFSFAGGFGHLQPMLELAGELRARGFRLGISGEPTVLSRTADFDDYYPDPDASAPIAGTTGTLAIPRLTHELEVVGTYFVGHLGVRRAKYVRRIVAARRPVLIVCDEMDFGAQVAAEASGIRCVVVGVIASGALRRPEYVDAPLARLRASNGLDPDPRGEPSFRVAISALVQGSAVSTATECTFGPARDVTDAPANRAGADLAVAYRGYCEIPRVSDSRHGIQL